MNEKIKSYKEWVKDRLIHTEVWQSWCVTDLANVYAKYYHEELEAQSPITRGSGDVFKDMGITQESISVATEALFDSVQTVDDNADLHRTIKTLEQTNLYLHKRLEGVRDTCKIAEMQQTIDNQAWLISQLNSGKHKR